MLTGILLGLGAAVSHSFSYLFSRRFAHKFENSTVSLLVSAHLIMGVFSLILLPFVWPSWWPGIKAFAPWLACSAVFYLAGQVFLFLSLKRSDASRVSPLLGLKLLILALIGISFLHQHYAPLQWIAIVLSLAATVMLSWEKGPVHWQGLAWIGCACFWYSLSDLSIKFLVTPFMYLGLAQASILSASMCYILTGIMALFGLLFTAKFPSAAWKVAFPFAVSWYGAMLLLFGCFASIGVVYGNILQSLRGIISVIFAVFVARAGYEHIEEKMTRAGFLKKAIAALCMTGAVALFRLGA